MRLDCSLFKDHGYHVCWCMQLDIVVSGISVEYCIDAMSRSSAAQISYAKSKGFLGNLFRNNMADSSESLLTEMLKRPSDYETSVSVARTEVHLHYWVLPSN